MRKGKKRRKKIEKRIEKKRGKTRRKGVDGEGVRMEEREGKGDQIGGRLGGRERSWQSWQGSREMEERKERVEVIKDERLLAM